MEPATIKQLSQWMVDNCYNDTSYEINGSKTYDGFGLHQHNNQYVWYYTERGQRQNLNYFDTEQQAVAFAFNQISNDKYAKRHMVGFVNDKSDLAALLREFEGRNIVYEYDEILYRTNDTRTRVFVLGCDIKLVLDLQEKYGWHK